MWHSKHTLMIAVGCRGVSIVGSEPLEVGVPHSCELVQAKSKHEDIQVIVGCTTGKKKHNGSYVGGVSQKQILT